MEKFGRKYELIIGNPYTVTRKEILDGPEKFYESKVRAIEDELLSANRRESGFLFNEHQIEFSFEKNKSGVSPNAGSITIINAPQTLVDYLDNKSGKKTAVALKCGYEGSDLNLIFIGNIERVIDTFNRETRRTSLHLVDGGVNFQEATTVRYYPKGTSADEIIEGLMSDTLLPKSGANVYKLGITIDKPWYFSGSSFVELTKFAHYYDYNFSVQDGTCLFTPTGKARRREIVAKITPDTGLVGTITAIDRNDGISQNKASSNNPGVKFKCLLDGTLLPENLVYAEDSNRKGAAYKMTKVSHKGSFEGDYWYTEVEAEQVQLLEANEI